MATLTLAYATAGAETCVGGRGVATAPGAAASRGSFGARGCRHGAGIAARLRARAGGKSPFITQQEEKTCG